MRNDKKNSWYTNAGLFSTAYLTNKIQTRRDFPDFKDCALQALWRRLRAIWHRADSSMGSRLDASATRIHLIEKILCELNFHHRGERRSAAGAAQQERFSPYGLYDAGGLLALCQVEALSACLNGLDHAGRSKSEAGSCAVQLTHQLRHAKLTWGVLTDGKQWQLYRSSGCGMAAQYFEFDLGDALGHPVMPEEFCLFVYLFEMKAYRMRPGEHRCRLDDVFDEGVTYRRSTAKALFQGCREALRIIYTAYQKSSSAQRHGVRSEQAYQAAMLLLFRLVAIRYLEDRGVLPTLSASYRQLSLDTLRFDIEARLLQNKPASESKRTLWRRLQTLFRDVGAGHFGVGPTDLGLESPVFDVSFEPYFARYPLDDFTLDRVIDRVCRGAGKHRGQIDFYDLGVSTLGDLYNDLLAVRCVRDPDGRWGLLDSTSRKKDMGSYYTHPRLTRLASAETIRLLCAQPETRQLDRVKCLDNSCGSGHFLRQFVEDVAYAIYERQAASSLVDVPNINDIKRHLVQHAVYGIDKDPHALWLAKLSLRLETADAGKPCLFVDPHFSCEDALLASAAVPSVDACVQKALDAACPGLSRVPSETKEDIQTQRVLWTRLQTLTRHAMATVHRGTHRHARAYCEMFPDAFLTTARPSGFDAILGNPPWDTIKPKIADFYKAVTGSSRALKRHELDAWVRNSTARSGAYDRYRRRTYDYAEQIRRCAYKLQAGEIATYAYFTERALETLSATGVLLYVVKLGLLGDKHTATLRRHLAQHGRIHRLWLFRKNKLNDGTIFPHVDPNEKFVVMAYQKGHAADTPLAAKTVSDGTDISPRFAPWQQYTWSQHWRQGDGLTVYDAVEAKRVADKVQVAATLESLGVHAKRELDVTLDRSKITARKTGIPLYTGEDVKPYGVTPPRLGCTDVSLLLRCPTSRRARIAVNNILPNSRRKLRAGLVPAGALTQNSLMVLTGIEGEVMLFFILGCINAMVTEYVMRPRLTNINLNKFRAAKIPVPWSAHPALVREVAALSATLSRKTSFCEAHPEYAAIEALVATAHGLTAAEICAYVRSFPDTPVKFLSDVLGYHAKLSRHAVSEPTYRSI